ncbi:type I-E CRISPR-associated endonuclease Cas1e [Pararhodospirillum photometricum]|uniref:CRISPR-associated endonuclease Cas1 n=1 Tax=Pararhodospirillum photometricum DSM 122 TaxID=1150469 RepID=H6SIV7_PARPM|nr:type I-E CRISPR-associated endonuclease Cas1e [Pararhodospirillum photometricum]CCG07922.1 CRISPR-associated protein Cas1, putative [Pararhodospirillum photometricum DSM 122]
MLKGRLGLEKARIPHKSRHGLVYLEYCRLSIDNGSLTLRYDESGEEAELPYQAVSAILLGPGTTITHDAIRHLSAHGTAFMAVGSEGTRLYTAPPLFERSADLAHKQAVYFASDTTRLMVALRMYEKRFGERPRVSSLDALRGMEAQRIKRSYELLAAQEKIDWKGRHFDRGAPEAADLPNQAINHAVTALEAAVAIGVAATGTVPQLGFLHEAPGIAWTLDLCDLYRTTVTVPLAFRAVREINEGRHPNQRLERVVRLMMARALTRSSLIDTVIDDIKEILA